MLSPTAPEGLFKIVKYGIKQPGRELFARVESRA